MARQFIAAVTASLCLVLSPPLEAQKDGRLRGDPPDTAKRSASSKPGAARTAPGHRTHSNRAAHSQAATRAFEVQTGYPNGRPGYVVDHIRPLACGGVDAPSNMQWQTIAAARAKHKAERAGCR
jgi:hypothetical protein